MLTKIIIVYPPKKSVVQKQELRAPENMTFITIQIQNDSFQSTGLRIKPSLHMQSFRVSSTRHKADMPSGKNKVSKVEFFGEFAKRNEQGHFSTTGWSVLQPDKYLLQQSFRQEDKKN